MELKPTELILRRREAPSRRMAAGSVSLVAVLRDARKSALLKTRLFMRRYDSNLGNAVLQHVPTAMNRDSQDTPEVRV
jgi:hypothetical protein